MTHSPETIERVVKALEREYQKAGAWHSLGFVATREPIDLKVFALAALDAAHLAIPGREYTRKLERRIHNQRLANRETWQIVEERRKWLGSHTARNAYAALLKRYHALKAAHLAIEERLAEADAVIAGAHSEAGQMDPMRFRKEILAAIARHEARQRETKG